MKVSRWINLHFAASLGSMSLYMVIFLTTYSYIGMWAPLGNAIPAITLGWLMGVRGGFFYLLLATPINIFLFSYVQSTYNELTIHVLGLGAYTLVSIGIGWMRDLRELNGRIRWQATELELERKLLQAEIERRTRVEEKLAHRSVSRPAHKPAQSPIVL